jgi:hypothetical protein
MFENADWLSVEHNKGYGPLPIPQARDVEISDILKAWTRLDDRERQESAKGISEGQRPTLLAYSERMASQAVRTHNVECIVLGLLALGIDGWRGEWRENAMVISLHHDAALRLGCNVTELFDKASSLLPLKVSSAIRSFVNRSESDKALDAMGYTTGSDLDGFRYERTW